MIRLINFLIAISIIAVAIFVFTGNKLDNLPVSSVGRQIQTEKFEIRITRVTRRPIVGNYEINTELIAPQGSFYLEIVYSYKNITNKPMGRHSGPRIVLIDSDGNKYQHSMIVTAAAFSERVYYDGSSGDMAFVNDPNPGITVKSIAVFNVANTIYNAATWKLLVDADKDSLVKLSG